MPLRDFDQVRERIHLRVEVRHIVQGVLLLLTLIGGAFAGGIWYAGKHPQVSAASAVAEPAAAGEGLPPAAVAVAEAVTSSAPEAPIVPVPIAGVAAAPDAVIAIDVEPATAKQLAAAPVAEPSPEQLATAPGERAVPEAEVAVVVAPVAKAPAVVAVAATQAPIVPALAPKPLVVAAPQRAPLPHGLSLFGTLRMAPTVALVSATPPPVAVTVAEAKIAAPPQVHKPVQKPREDDVRPPPVNGHYVLQIKAFRDQQEAKAFEADLRAKGHSPKLTSIEVPEKGTFYRVRLGPFDSLDAARAAQKQYEATEGHDTILLAVP
jgi:DedD protein